jgi:Protein of unknown function DUF262
MRSGRGDTQLPDFQRGWVWDDPHIKSLIASLSLSYPIGAVMFLEAGGVPFKPRLFEGVLLNPTPDFRFPRPEFWLFDRGRPATVGSPRAFGVDDTISG